MNALHDKAFDRGFMTILVDGRIKISDHLKDIYDGETIDAFFGVYANQEIIQPEKFVPEKEFLQYHNDLIFESWRK